MEQPFGASPGLTVTLDPSPLKETMCPASMSFSVAPRSWSWRTRLRVMPLSLAIAPATMKVPASIRSGMTVWCVPPREVTPSMVMRRVPAPSILAPIEMRKSARSTTSGSQAADSMMVVPLARTAAIMRLSVPRTVGPCLPRRSTSVPVRPSFAAMNMLPPSVSMVAPIAWRPFR